MQQNGGKVAIDFNSKILPRTIVVNVKQNSFVIGDETTTIGALPEINFGLTKDDNLKTFAILNEFDGSTIDKVIMNNGTDFKIWSFDEFMTNIKNQMKAFFPEVKDEEFNYPKPLGPVQ